MQLHSNKTMRLIFASLGVVFVITGLIGIVVPILPTTPFMLLAAACFARSSERFYRGLKNNRVFGPIITEWELQRTMPKKIKIRATVLILMVFSISIVFFASNPTLQIILAVIAIILIAFLLIIHSSKHQPIHAMS